MNEKQLLGGEGIVAISLWNEGELKKTAFDFIAFFIRELSSLGTNRWIAYLTEDLSKAITIQTFKPAAFRAEGFDLVYYGPIPTNLESDPEREVFFEKEPQFVLYDRSYLNLLPRERNILYNATEDLIEEAPKAYGMKIDRNKDDTAFVFPKEQYAKSSNIYFVPLLKAR